MIDRATLCYCGSPRSFAVTATPVSLRRCFVVEYDTSAAGEAKSALSEAEEAEEAEKESTPPAPSKGSAEHQDEMLDAFLAARKDEAFGAEGEVEVAEAEADRATSAGARRSGVGAAAAVAAAAAPETGARLPLGEEGAGARLPGGAEGEVVSH
ncbi:unnamed protein product [Polarella glacialis]|uniref:Uncharacterized protein n=1 Tax=Polarella glacialis TaxID=89957 RepID=A0A813L2I1_POLGL|nr:unnamed protein product [Polarella glacialis]